MICFGSRFIWASIIHYLQRPLLHLDQRPCYNVLSGSHSFPGPMNCQQSSPVSLKNWPSYSVSSRIFHQTGNVLMNDCWSVKQRELTLPWLLLSVFCPKSGSSHFILQLPLTFEWTCWTTRSSDWISEKRIVCINLTELGGPPSCFVLYYCII